jgi:exopolysaccharide biosynthesis polyprenyl glycosylphosphotransferase
MGEGVVENTGRAGCGVDQLDSTTVACDVDALSDHVPCGRATGATGGWLKVLLKALDVAALLTGWAWAVGSTVGTAHAGGLELSTLLALGCVGIIAALSVMASRRLWLSRVCTVHSKELEGLGQTAVLSAMVVIVAGDVLVGAGPARFALHGATAAFVLTVVMRRLYTKWLRRQRRHGRFVRPLVLVGATHHAFDLAALVDQRPDSGYRIVGVCGPWDVIRGRGLAGRYPWLGDIDDVVEATARAGATGALVVSSALDSIQVNRTVRRLMSSGRHVHLSSGVRGVTHERLLPSPMAREPVFYVERTTLSRSQLALKRAADITLSALLSVVVVPVVFVAAIAVKLEDGGPLFFVQERVGFEGRRFRLYKLRTMVPNAEQLLEDLLGANDRDGGPLFKLRGDPRVTRTGRFLRATSIDELPQLLNVLRGDMSLVGPRPALPDEVEQFDDELLARGRVMPGITGLWQVEGRDDPSFSSYRRLDLYYVDNWSLGLDIAILAATVGAVLSRGIRLARADDDA